MAERPIIPQPYLDPQTDQVLEQKIAIPYTTTQPTFTPRVNGVRRVYFDGADYWLYIYANGAWRTQKIGVTGGGTPGGSDTQIQFNDGGSFGGARYNYSASGNDSYLTHSGSGIGGIISPSVYLGNAGASKYIFIDDPNETCDIVFLASDSLYAFRNSNGSRAILDFSVSSGSETYTFQDGSGVLAFKSDYEAYFDGTVNTTTATTTTLASYSVPTNKSIMLFGKVTARRTGGTAGAAGDSAFYQMVALVSDNAGTPTIKYQNNTETYEDQAGWACVFDISSGSVRVRVTGAADNNITWSGKIEVVTAN